MFRKLVSNLPFNPSLMSQVSFYAKRVKEEDSVRRMGFGLIALAMFIQMFAVMAPPEKSLAASANHIINGLRTKTDILNAWDRPGSDIPAIYGKFGLTRADIEGLPMNPNTTLRSTGTGPDYWTIGRTSITTRTDINYLYRLSEVALQADSTTIYMRQLAAWNIVNASNSYQAFTGTKADGTQFWILVDCGNYTQVGKFTPAAPKLDMRKSVVGNATNLKPGDTFTFRFEYRNIVKDSMAENVVIEDTFDLANYDVVSPTNLTLAGPNLRQGVGSLAYTDNYQILDITVRLKNPFPGLNGETCNVAQLSSTNAPAITAGPACVTVVTPCQYDASKPSNDPKCVPPCEYNTSIPSTDPTCKPPVDVCPNITGNQATIPAGLIKDAAGNCVVPPTPVDVCPNIEGTQATIPAGKVKDAAGNCVNPCVYDPSVPDGATCKKPELYCALVDTYLDRAKREATFKTTVTSSNQKQTQIISYAYDFGDNSPVLTNLSTQYNNTAKHVYGAGAFTARVIVTYGVTGVTGTQQINCTAPVQFDGNKPFGELKTVKNVTQKLEGEKAIDTVVNAGDVLEYTITIANTQDFDRGTYTATDYIGDILDYATLDTEFLKTQGGTFDDKTNKVSFVLAGVPAKKDVSKQFRVTLKNPIPATNSPSNVSGTYDCKISNRFGNDIVIGVNCPTVKGIENLPNTGPGTSLIMGFSITMIAGYFFMRSRIMSKELSIIKSEYAPSGGGY